jgi:hypothetical protein
MGRGGRAVEPPAASAAPVLLLFSVIKLIS